MNINIRKPLLSLFPWVLLLFTACGGGGSTSTEIQMGGGLQGAALNLVPAVSTLAGAFPGADGTGAAARLDQPLSSTTDGVNLYVTTCGMYSEIRKIVIATGVVTTLAGTNMNVTGAADGIGTVATFNCPEGITTDGSSLYVVDSSNNKIRKISPSSGTLSTMTSANAVVTSFTGTPNTLMSCGAGDGLGSTATFCFPSGITTDGTNLYVSDSGNSKIRQIVIASGVTSSLTGTSNIASYSGADDGAGSTATFNNPLGITTDGTNLYVSDAGNNKIRTVAIADGVTGSLTGTVNTWMSPGANDGVNSTATFNSPSGITIDGAKLYVSDAGNNKIRTVVIASGATGSMTGTANAWMSPGANDGLNSTAAFTYPTGIATDATSLYVIDNSNGTVRQVTISSGQVSTLAGAVAATDGTGKTARMDYPYFSTTDGVNLYVTDCGRNSEIRKVAIATGVVTTLAGSITAVTGATDGIGTAATFNCPEGITTDGNSLYVVDTSNNKIRKISPSSGTLSAMTSANAVVTSFTGTANTVMSSGANDGVGSTATFCFPTGVTTDGTNLYVADTCNNKVRQIVIATSVVSSITGTANTTMGTGATDGAGSTATFALPLGITTDGTNLYVTDTFNNKIRQIVIASGVTSSLTGVANTVMSSGANDGAGSTATFDLPIGIATDGTNLYVVDSHNQKIREIVIATGATSSITGMTGTAMGTGATDGTGSVAEFYNPTGIATDDISLYVMDYNNGTVRQIK